MYRRWGKRLLDLLVAIPGLVLAIPILVLASLALWIAHRESPFFIQARPGLNGKLFSMIKLKTMRTMTDSDGRLLPDNLRTSAIGVFFRKTSIDELPQFINVIAGDMSIVGPRPLLTAYLPLYTGEQARRHEVKPGITGWAQVNGRNAIHWERKFACDLWYMDNLGFAVDLKIILLTLGQIVNVGKLGEVTVVETEPFKGSSS